MDHSVSMGALFSGHEIAGVYTAGSHGFEIGKVFISGPVNVGGGLSFP